jgi:hypothetical protein
MSGSIDPTAPLAWTDPLFVRPGSTFNDWYAKALEIAQRSWRSLLMVTVVGIGLPTAIVDFIAYLSNGYYALRPDLALHMDTLFGTGRLLFGAFVTFMFALAASFFTAVGWAAATWTVVVEASGGRAPLGDAINYGLRRAGQLWLWTVAVGVIVAIGTLCLLVVPGIYAAFALSLFGFCVIFERDINPLTRSVKLIHADLASTGLRVVALAVAVFVYAGFVNLIFSTVETGIAPAAYATFDTGFGTRFALGILGAINQLAVATPVAGALLVGLLPIYAEQRGRAAAMSTSRLRHELDA